MHGIYYDQINRRLVYTGQEASADYWDKQWQKSSDVVRLLKQGSRDNLVRKITELFLKPGLTVRILDGGCGKGQRVVDLDKMGYDAYGIDYAAETINIAKQIRPDIDLRVGDVKKLPYEDGYFDGYWSLGLIEHEQDGYDDMAQEMVRVVKPGGFLFLVFPHMSRLRKLKAAFKMYELLDDQEIMDEFYEYVLNHEVIARDFMRRGFRLRYVYRNNGYKGIKEEVGKWQPWMQSWGDSKWVIAKVTKVVLSESTRWFNNHTVVLVLQKKA